MQCKFLCSYAANDFFPTELLESIRSEKKRKMEDTTGYAICFALLAGLLRKNENSVAKKKRKAITKKVGCVPAKHAPSLMICRSKFFQLFKVRN